MAEPDLVLAASTLEEKGQRVVEAPDPHAVLGLSSGSGRSFNPKHQVNEDSVALHRLPDGAWLAAVADAHWGASSSEAIVRHLRPAFERTRGATVLDRLRLTLRGLDARIQRERDPDDRSETTVVLAHLAGDQLTFVSVGDSPLLVLGRGAATLRNPPSGGFPLPFVGNVPLADLPGDAQPDGGRVTLRPGEVALLATDGIEPEASSLAPQDVVRLVLEEGRPLRERVERLLAAADDPARGGGADNLGVVALEA